MKVLFINHSFEQDIASLLAAVPDDVESRVVPATHWATPARRFFPSRVFCDLATYWSGSLAHARNRWARRAMALMHDIYFQFPFDVIVTPSDVFFYLFDVVQEARRLGIPVIVVQKETTITDYTMQQHSAQVRRWAPFSSTRMTVCSERHKRFWVAAGADPSLIEVTGQPRFDAYFTPDQVSGDSRSSDRRSLLFLSYDLNAYSESGQGVVTSAAAPWRALRDSTMDVLTDVAARHRWELVVKPHPQQDRADIAEISADVARRVSRSPELRAIVADPRADTRELIRRADAVVGFQTTAIFEAIAAGRQVIYTGWGDEFWTQKEILIPFHEWSTLLHVADSPDDLRAALEAGGNEARAAGTAWLAAYTEYLGPADGGASKRTWAVIRRVMREEAMNGEAAAPLRGIVARSRWRWRRVELLRAGFGRAGAAIAEVLLPSKRHKAKARETGAAWSRRIGELQRGSPSASASTIHGLGFTSLTGFVERALRNRFGWW